MKKRILLIIALGVTFTPAIFAGTDLGPKVQLAKTGELKQSQYEAGSIDCAAKLKNLPASGSSFGSESGKSKSGSAR